MRGIALKLASATFFLLLLGAHVGGDLGQRLAQPLSLFRDGGQGWLGYLLFAVLLLIGLLYMRALIHAGKEEEAVSAGLAALLLFIVAATPSFQGFHLLSSLLLLLLLFGHYWRLLRDSGSPWLIAHSLAPLVLVFLSGCQSYGLWQKSLILYLVVLANIRHHLLGRGEAGQALSAASRRWLDRGGGIERRKVYRLESERGWARRKAR
jgi:hypothetical protein